MSLQTPSRPEAEVAIRAAKTNGVVDHILASATARRNGLGGRVGVRGGQG